MDENNNPQDAQLDKTQRIRMKIIDKLGEDEYITDDQDKLKLMMTALKDADSQALGIKRIRSNEDIAQDEFALQKELHANALELASITGNKSIFHKDSDNTRGGIDIEGQAEMLPDVDTIDGQMDIGISSETYDEFTTRVRSEIVED